VAELDKLKSRMEEAHSQRCEGDFSLNQYYRECLLEYAKELLRTEDIEEIGEMITRLEKEAVVIQEEIENFWGICDVGVSLGELQDDYCELVSKHIRLLDLLEVLK